MEGLVTFQGIPADKLLECFRVIVREEVAEAVAKLKKEEKYISPNATCNLFEPKISLVTLNSWVAKGKLIKHRIGGRVYFKQSEVLAALQSLKKYERI